MNYSFRKTSFFLTLFFSLTYFSSFAQGTVWLDINHNTTTADKGVYYRPVPKKERKGYYIVDYYKGGGIYREGEAESTTVNKEGFKGILLYYYEDGVPSKGVEYKRGLMHGDYIEYFDTGEVKVQGKYEYGLQEGSWKIYYKSGKIKTKGKYREGEKVGVWKTFYKNVYYPEDE